MDTRKFLADLYTERKRLDAAIAALEALSPSDFHPPSGLQPKRGRPKSTQVGSTPTTKKRVLSPEGRERIAEAARKRWAKQKKAAAATAKKS